MKRLHLYTLSAIFGLCAIWLWLLPVHEGVNLVSLFLNVFPATAIHVLGIHSFIVNDYGHIPSLSKAGIGLLYGLPFMAFFIAAYSRSKFTKR